ncbi:MAG TPA: ATP-binding protein [Candidatus Ozemobacteraceae bacterium]|nr:ATP-binding protein [Candidatus Ozemobacteraceae bacterium]
MRISGRFRFDFPVWAAVIYAVIGCVWILLSDRVVTMMTGDPVRLTFLQTYKGWAYVGVTAILLFSVLRSEWNRLQTEIRARNQAEEELRRLNTELEERVSHRTAELARAKEQAESADRIKSAFLATMSHELRTPLNSIIGFTGILLQGLTGPLNEEQHKQLGMVQSSSRHLLSLINDILDISKIEAGQLKLQMRPFDLRPSLNRVAELISPTAKAKGLDLRVKIADEIASITTDQQRLEQILLNLLSNAVKFTDHGLIELSCRTNGDECLLEVMDTGMGIRPEEMSNLFKPFHQLDNGLTRKHEGTGLGLSICRKLIGLMGGTIEADSRWGEGSTFTVRLPLRRETPAMPIGTDASHGETVSAAPL